MIAANMAALYYGYCMLPDGTYCLAPPPPGIDASTYYSSMPAGMMPAHSASPAPPPPGTTPPPDSAITVPSAPAAAAALPPASAPMAHATPSGFYTTRYVCLTPFKYFTFLVKYAAHAQFTVYTFRRGGTSSKQRLNKYGVLLPHTIIIKTYWMPLDLNSGTQPQNSCVF